MKPIKFAQDALLYIVSSMYDAVKGGFESDPEEGTQRMNKLRTFALKHDLPMTANAAKILGGRTEEEKEAKEKANFEFARTEILRERDAERSGIKTVALQTNFAKVSGRSTGRDPAVDALRQMEQQGISFKTPGE